MERKKVLKVTKDVSANQRILKRLERDGHIELYVNDMELPESGSKIKNRNSLTFGFTCDEPDCRCHDGIGGFGDGSDEKPHAYWMETEHEKIIGVITSIIGSANRRDCRQLFHHYVNKRDVFATEDRDFLNVSCDLKRQLNIVVKSPEELQRYFSGD